MILLVVLGGGAGLLAVWSVHPGSRPRLTGRPGLRSLRASRPEVTTRSAASPETRSGPIPPDAMEPAGSDEAVGSGTTAVLEVVEAPAEPDRVTAAVDATPPAGPSRRRRRGGVPRAFTAIEGTYRDVAVVPVWRKALSLVLLLAVLFGMGVGLAAMTAAGLGVAAELVDRAIG